MALSVRTLTVHVVVNEKGTILSTKGSEAEALEAVERLTPTEGQVRKGHASLNGPWVMVTREWWTERWKHDDKNVPAES